MSANTLPASKQAASFLAKAGIKAYDLEHRRKITFNMAKYNAAVPLGKKQFAHLEKARQFAHTCKQEAIDHLHHYLLQFEANFTRNGGTVIWAADASEAQNAVLEICKKANARTLVKSKSMVTEEIHLNEFLAEHGVESIETDLGEYIQQLDDEPPYHIVTPAMHKSKEDVAKLFANKLGCEPNLSPEQLTQVARHKLRKKYMEAEVGLSGANFLIADTGSIALTENEGNARLSTSCPRVHIAIAGIEKLLPSMQQLGLFWPLLSTYGTGQTVTVYNTIISGPRKSSEATGPEEMYVILLDNGRTNLLADARARQALYCIRCGSCLNACPVYKNIGGHSYNTTYSGPIGKVITPWLRGWEGYKHLSHASSLCGNCTEVCPVKIPLHELLLYNRNESVKKGTSGLAERLAWKGWKLAMLNRGMLNMGNQRLKNKFSKYLGPWNTHHQPIEFSEKTFNQMWKSGEV